MTRVLSNRDSRTADRRCARLLCCLRASSVGAKTTMDGASGLTPVRASNDSAASLAATARRVLPGRGTCQSPGADTPELEARGTLIGHGAKGSLSPVPMMHSPQWPLESSAANTEGSPAGAHSVISRIHSVRESIRSHTDTNEALLQSLAQRIIDGQTAGKNSASEAIAAVERQRQETMSARDEARRLGDALREAEQELKTCLEEIARLAPTKEALARCEREFATERALREEHFCRLQLQERDLEMMCNDLVEAESALENARMTVHVLQDESDTHRSERDSEAAAVVGVLQKQAMIERSFQQLVDALNGLSSLDHGRQRRNEDLQRQLDLSNETLVRVNMDLAERGQELAVAQASVAQMYRAVCGKFKTAGIGIKLSLVDDSAGRNVVVGEIIPGGPAEASGRLRVGDIVLGIDGQNPLEMREDELRSQVAGVLGSTKTLNLFRRGDTLDSMEFQLTLPCGHGTKLSLAGQAADVSDCAHSVFVEMTRLSCKHSSILLEMEAQQTSMSSMQCINGGLRSDLDRYRQNVDDLRHQVEVLESELIQAHDDAQATSKGMEIQISAVEHERNTLKKQLVDSHVQIEKLAAKFDRSLYEVQSECSGHLAAAKEKAVLVDDLTSILSKRDREVAFLTAEIERMKRESSRVRVDRESLERQLLLLQQTHDEVKSELIHFRQENIRLLNHLESERSRAEATESELTRALASSQLLDMEKASVCAQNMTVSSELAALREQHQTALDHIKQMDAQVALAQNNLHTLQADNALLVSEKQDLERMRLEAAMSLSQALGEVENLRSEAEFASARLKNELQTAGEVAQEQLGAHSVLMKERDMIESDLMAARQSISLLHGQLHSAGAELALLKTRAMDLEGALATETRKRQDSAKENKEISESLHTLQREIEQAILLLRDVEGRESSKIPAKANSSLMMSVQKAVTLFQNEKEDRSRVDQERARLQETLSQISIQLKQEQDLHKNDLQELQKLQSAKQTLESQVSTLNQSLESFRSTKTACSCVREEKLVLKSAAAHQITQLRTQLHSYAGDVQERIMTFHAEIEDVHLSIENINKDLRAMRNDRTRDIFELNDKVHGYEGQLKGMRDVIKRQEGAVARRTAEMERATSNLEVLMDRLVETEAILRVCHRADQDAWALRTAEVLRRGRMRSKFLPQVFRLWACRGSKRNVVRRWESLAVGAVVCGLDRHARRAVVKKRLNNFDISGFLSSSQPTDRTNRSSDGIDHSFRSETTVLSDKFYPKLQQRLGLDFKRLVPETKLAQQIDAGGDESSMELSNSSRTIHSQHSSSDGYIPTSF